MHHYVGWKRVSVSVPTTSCPGSGKMKKALTKIKGQYLNILSWNITESVSGFSILLIKINENKKDHTRCSTKSNQSVKESSAFARSSTHHTNNSHEDHNLFWIIVPHTVQQSVPLSGSMISRLLLILVDETLGPCWCRKVWLVPGIPDPAEGKEMSFHRRTPSCVTVRMKVSKNPLHLQTTHICNGVS